MSDNDTFNWPLSFVQSQLLYNCLNQARKCDDIGIARNAFAFMDSLMSAINAAGKAQQDKRQAEQTKAAEDAKAKESAPAAPNGHAADMSADGGRSFAPAAEPAA
mgnify:CR=1 FL=1